MRNIMEKGEVTVKTGATANFAGLYYSECCSCEMTFVEGQTFVRCPKCSSLTVWEFIEDVGTQAA
jgi:hypothetical protein